MESKYQIFMLMSLILWTFYNRTTADNECTFDLGLARKCCDILEYLSDEEKCFNKLQDSKEHTNEERICALECYFKAHFGFKNYTFDPHRVDAFLEQAYSEKEKKKILPKIKTLYDSCQDEVRAKAVLVDASKKYSTNCSIYSVLFQQCLMYESLVHCPKEKFKKAKQCFALLKLMKKCSYLKAYEQKENKQ